MQILKSIGISLFVYCLLTSCQTPQQKLNQNISAGVYATKAAIDAGRFDQAKRYNDELTRIVAPPKKPIKINYFVTDSKSRTPGDLSEYNKKYVVLPAGFDTSLVISMDSKEYQEILNENKKLAAEEKKTDENFQKYSSQTTKIIQERENELSKTKKASWFAWLTSAVGLTGIIGLIAIMVFFPALIPVIVGFFGRIFAYINLAIAALTSKFKK